MRGVKGVYRPMPEDYRIWAAVECDAQIRRRYEAGNSTAARWRKQSGIPRPHQHRTPVNYRPVPDTFAQMAATMPRSMLAIHFNCGVTTVQRWANETGVVLRKGRPAGKRGFNVVTIDTRTDSEASRAQSFLQRFYPVWRCDELGRFDPKGTHFRCDGITRTQDEMIERAVRKGWQRDDWRRIAA